MKEQKKLPKLIGAFKQVITMNHLPDKGAISNTSLEVLENVGVLVKDSEIQKIAPFEELLSEAKVKNYIIENIEGDRVLLPGLIDSHTHLCWAGTRSQDYMLRTEGASYLEIAKGGGGILQSVKDTRNASLDDLVKFIITRAQRHLMEGVTTCEVKSGYGLSVEQELKILKAINLANWEHPMGFVPTCLAAHLCPPEFDDRSNYLQYLVDELFPRIQSRGLTSRMDIFVEDTAFQYEEAKIFLLQAKKAGFSVVVHADQFSTEGSKLACEIGAVSADHLEAIGEREIELLAQSDIVTTALPGASLGLGMAYTPGRKLLDAGCCVAIATDWNPGSAPMGDLLMQAAVFGAFEKLTFAETFAGITYRAAKALKKTDRGILAKGKLADMIAFPTGDYREILYHQGKMKPASVWKRGALVTDNNS